MVILTGRKCDSCKRENVDVFVSTNECIICKRLTAIEKKLSILASNKILKNDFHEAVIFGGREKAKAIFDSEIFTLNQYLKDPEMKILHEKRFGKMLAAMETAIRIFDYLDELEGKSS